MIGYATLGTNDLSRSAAYYDPLLALLGARRLWEMDRGIAWGTRLDAPSLGLLKPFDGQPATPGNGTMIALAATSREQVDAVYAKAIELGGRDEGPAGARGKTFYAGYFRDPDGNKLCVFFAG